MSWLAAFVWYFDCKSRQSQEHLSDWTVLLRDTIVIKMKGYTKNQKETMYDNTGRVITDRCGLGRKINGASFVLSRVQKRPGERIGGGDMR